MRDPMPSTGTADTVVGAAAEYPEVVVFQAPTSRATASIVMTVR